MHRRSAEFENVVVNQATYELESVGMLAMVDPPRRRDSRCDPVTEASWGYGPHDHMRLSAYGSGDCKSLQCSHSNCC